AASGGILTGVILALSRAIGETAPLIVIGALAYVPFVARSPLDEFTVLPMQIFNWISRPQEAFLVNGAAAIIILLAITFCMNGIAVYLRNRWQKKINWEPMKLIVAEDVNAYYGDNHVLKNISLSISENTVTAFIGPSGCGKTTFLRTLNRMNDYIDSFRVEGKIKIDGKDIYGNKVRVEELRQKVGMVFQKPNPFPKSIFDNVAYGFKVQGTNDKKFIAERVEKSLRQAALWNEVKDILHKPALSLSGGQQQRLCIARTLAVKPSIVLMDEPASALDP